MMPTLAYAWRLRAARDAIAPALGKRSNGPWCPQCQWCGYMDKWTVYKPFGSREAFGLAMMEAAGQCASATLAEPPSASPSAAKSR